MDLLFLVLFLAVGGSVVSGFEICNSQLKKCFKDVEEMFPDPFTNRNWFPPTPEILNTVCSPSVIMLDCMVDATKECTGKTLDELTSSDNKTIATGAKLLSDTRGVVLEVCDEDSSLHKGYVENVQCFRSMAENAVGTCRREALDVIRVYKESLTLVGDEEDVGTLNAEEECIIASYTLACITLEVQKTCGEEARHTLMEILKRVHPVVLDLCSPEDFIDAKNKFMDYLAYEGEKRDQFSEAFRLGRRRR